MTDQPSDRIATGEPTRRTVLKSGALAGGVFAVGSGAALVQDDGSGEESTDDEAETPFAGVEFTNQESNGSDVVVDATVLSEPGYVAFHDGSLLDGQVAESVVGVTEYQEPGITYQTEATLFDVEGAEFDETELTETTPLIAMPHRETSENETYDFVASDGEDDGPFTEAGLPVVDLAYVVVDGAETDSGGETATPTATPTETEDGTATPTDDEGGTPFASVDFENQIRTDDAVTVGEVLLSDGGFVVLHDARLLDGAAVESVVGASDYLEPGKHRNVSVTLDDPDEITEVALPAPPLIAMPHMDTNSNQNYDFATSDGSEDGPYTSAEQPVVDVALVSPESGGEEADAGTPTETPTESETSTENATDTGEH